MPVSTFHDALKDVVAVAHQGARLCLKLLLHAPAVLEGLSGLLDGIFLLLVGQRRIEELDRDLSHRLAKHRFKLPEGTTSNLKPLVEAVINPLVDRVLVDQVEDRHLLLRLAQSVDTADSLLETHRIPWQVVVHHDRAELEVHTFTADFGGEQDPNVVGVLEPRKDVRARALDTPMQQLGADPLVAKTTLEVAQRRLEAREHDDLGLGLSLPEVSKLANEKSEFGVDFGKRRRQIERMRTPRNLCEERTLVEQALPQLLIRLLNLLVVTTGHEPAPVGRGCGEARREKPLWRGEQEALVDREP